MASGDGKPNPGTGNGGSGNGGSSGVKNTDHWAEWSYVDALRALTDDAADLWNISWTPSSVPTSYTGDAPAKSDTQPASSGSAKINDVQWIIFDAADTGKTLDDSKPENRHAPQDFAYYAWDKQYFAAQIDWNAIKAWEKAVDDAAAFFADFAKGTRNSLNAYSLAELWLGIAQFEGWLEGERSQWQSTADALKTDNSSFQGKAAQVIEDKMAYYANLFDSYHTQVAGTGVTPPSAAAIDAYNALATFVHNLSKAFEVVYNDDIHGIPRNQVIFLLNNIYLYLDERGLIYDSMNPNAYQLDAWAAQPGGRADAEYYINGQLHAYKGPDGSFDLRSPDFWAAVNKYISGVLATYLSYLDAAAQKGLQALSDAYWTLGRALKALKDPHFTPHNFGPNGYGGNANGPPFNLNFPPFGFNGNPFGFNGNPFGFNGNPFSTDNLNQPPFGMNSPPFGGPNIPSNLFDGLGHMFDPLNGMIPSNLFDPFASMMSPLNGMIPSNLFDGLGNMMSPLNGMIPSNLFNPLGNMMSPLNGMIPSNLGLPGPAGSGLGTGVPLPAGLSPGLLGGQQPLLDQNGQPVLGPHGELLGQDGKPLLGPHGELLGPDGKPLLGKKGELLGPDGKPLTGPHGELLGPNGQPLTGPHGELLGPNGKPLIGKDGKPLTVGGLPFLDGPKLPQHLSQGLLPSGGFGGGGRGGGLPGLGGGQTATAGAGLPGLGGGGGLPPGIMSGTPPGQSTPGAAGEAGPAGFGGMGGLGGMPYMPPGMGGMGNGDRKERERQTWLSEDEKVWGTDVSAGMAVIGLPDEDDEEVDAEEFALPLGPVRAPRQTSGRQTPAAGSGRSEGEEGETATRGG